MIFESKLSQDVLRDCVRRVINLKPNQKLIIGWEFLEHIETIKPFKPQDRVLENIIGSSFQYGYIVDHIRNEVSFFKLQEPLDDDRRTYVSPDRRQHYDFNGTFYTLKKKNATQQNP